ncbi:MAG TPA: hypothetical protein VMD59_11040 [Acidimicrobiales bacterium]|nr:hypothetical protein [Acidimicrobiales bacterium]
MTNTSTSTLHDVTVHDPGVSGCVAPTERQTLAPGASFDVWCWTAHLASSVTNTASVTYVGQVGPAPTSSARAVTIPLPKTSPRSSSSPKPAKTTAPASRPAVVPTTVVVPPTVVGPAVTG